MCSNVAIAVKNLTKTYRIFEHPGDRIKQALTLGRVKYHKNFCALRDVTFEIKKGETVGIIGQNGSGKSTLLQLIGGILKPTSGNLMVNGRVAALLELGAGFNPEFTGRENVYFQGAVMGFTQADMQMRFAEIARFADIGEFIDQPVRMYSSGMFVRLAFAVASSMEAEIILIDEALAVGDVAFQARCYRRLKELQEGGATILLVSHSSAQILRHVDSAMMLERGVLTMFSKDVLAVVGAYENAARNTREQPIQDAPEVDKDHNPKQAQVPEQMHQHLRLEALRGTQHDLYENRFGTFEAILDNLIIVQDGAEKTLLSPGKETIFRFSVESSRIFDEIVLGVSIRLPSGGDVWGDNNLLAGHPIKLHVGRNLIEYVFDFPLAAGEYLIFCGLATLESQNRIELDQRWPMEKITVSSGRGQVGYVYSPITVRTTS